MKVKELKELIDTLVNLDMGEQELRFAYQPNYPLQDYVGGVWYSDLSGPYDGPNDKAEGKVYLVSGGQDRDMPYAPRRAFDDVVRFASHL
jgi:hypothetical protein